MQSHAQPLPGMERFTSSALEAIPSSLLPTYIVGITMIVLLILFVSLTPGVAWRLEHPSRTGNKQNRPTHFIVVSFKRNAPVFVMVPLRAWTDTWLHHHPSSVECSPPPRGKRVIKFYLLFIHYISIIFRMNC